MGLSVLLAGGGTVGLVLDGDHWLSALAVTGALVGLALAGLVLRKSPRKTTPRLWELEDVYGTLAVQLSSHRERREEALAAGRRAFRGGAVADQELAYLEDTYEDLRHLRRQLLAVNLRAGGDPARLREIDARLEKSHRELEAAL